MLPQPGLEPGFAHATGNCGIWLFSFFTIQPFEDFFKGVKETVEILDLLAVNKQLTALVGMDFYKLEQFLIPLFGVVEKLAAHVAVQIANPVTDRFWIARREGM